MMPRSTAALNIVLAFLTSTRTPASVIRLTIRLPFGPSTVQVFDRNAACQSAPPSAVISPMGVSAPKCATSAVAVRRIFAMLDGFNSAVR